MSHKNFLSCKNILSEQQTEKLTFTYLSGKKSIGSLESPVVLFVVGGQHWPCEACCIDLFLYSFTRPVFFDFFSKLGSLLGERDAKPSLRKPLVQGDNTDVQGIMSYNSKGSPRAYSRTEEDILATQGLREG